MSETRAFDRDHHTKLYTHNETCKSEQTIIINQWYIIIQLNRQIFSLSAFSWLFDCVSVFFTVAIFFSLPNMCVRISFYLCSHCKWTLRFGNDIKIMMTTATATTMMVAAAVMATTAAANHSYKFENWKYARKRHVQATYK